MNDLDFIKAAEHIYSKLVAMFPASEKSFNTHDKISFAVKVLATAMRQRNVDQVKARRILYWSAEHDSQWCPSVGQMMKWTVQKTPEEIEQGYRESERERLQVPEISEDQTSKNRAIMKELMLAMNDEKKMAELKQRFGVSDD